MTYMEQLLARQKELQQNDTMSQLLNRREEIRMSNDDIPYIPNNDVPIQPPRPESLLEKANYYAEPFANTFAVQGVNALGDFGTNMIKRAGMAIPNLILNLAGEQPIPYHPIKSGKGSMYDITSEVAPWIPAMMVAPEATLPAALERMGFGGAWGALSNPENPFEGFATGLATSGLGEAGMPLAKGLGEVAQKGADYFTRNRSAQRMVESLTANFNEKKAEALSHLDPLLQSYGQRELPDRLAYKIMEPFEKNIKNFDPDTIDMYHAFVANPTLENAQALQSQVGSATRGIKTLDQAGRRELQALTKTRENLLESMGNFFDSVDPMASEEYNMFRKIYGQEVSPYLNKPAVNRIVHGETEGLSPKMLTKQVNKATQGTRSKVPEAHMLREEGQKMKELLENSELYKQSSIIGPIGSHYGFDLPNAIQNPALARGLNNLGGKTYPTMKQAWVANQLNPNDEEPSIMDSMISKLLKGNK